MSGIWVFSEDVDISKGMLSVGRDLADKISEPLNVITLDKEDKASDLIACGADKVIVLQAPENWPESYASAISDIVVEQVPTLMLFGATARGKDIAAKVAALSKNGLATEAVAIRVQNGMIETDRLIYGGLAICTEELSIPALVTIPLQSLQEPIGDANHKGEIEILNITVENEVTINEVCLTIRQGVNLEKAEKIICVGRGISKKEDIQMAKELAELLGGEVGCSRPIAEDYNWLPVECYIGLSGQKVKPQLYLAMGVSGQVQHIAGLRDSKIIVGIDRNEHAPIFDSVDYGIVGDLYEIVPSLIEAVKNTKRNKF